MLKLSMRRCCQPGFSVAAHSGSVGRLPRTSTDDGVRWKTYSCFADCAEVRHALHRVAPVPMMPTRLSRKLRQVPVESPPV